MSSDSSNEFLKAQVLVLHSAVSAMAWASSNRPEILVAFNRLSEQMISALLPLPASDQLIESVQAHQADFRKILNAPETTPPHT